MKQHEESVWANKPKKSALRLPDGLRDLDKTYVKLAMLGSELAEKSARWVFNPFPDVSPAAGERPF